MISQTDVTVPTGSPAASAVAERKRSPRERLLAAADELFYAEGIQSVGIDRVIERAGVAKASLYSLFGSKEGLVQAYLDARHARLLARRRAAAAAVDDPVEKILAVFDSAARDFYRPDFNGCAFAGAMAESPPGGRVDQASRSFRDDLRALLQELAAGAGARDPDLLARELQMLYDGGGLAAKLDRDGATVASQIRDAAAALVAAAV